jgi:hypothetical protein
MPPSKDPSRKPLARSLGEFFGHVIKGIRSKPAAPPPAGPERVVVRREIQEQVVPTDRGVVKLRRTTVDEVEIPPPNPPGR